MQQTQWAPSAVGTVVCGLVGVALAAATMTIVADAPGRLLLTLAAAGLVLFAVGTWRARPKLAVTDDGLQIGGWIRPVTVQKPEIKLIRITEFRRIGRKTRLLEIDVNDGRLFVFSRWDLGTDPLDVLDALTAGGYAGR